MPYAQGSRLPSEAASKLGHLAVVESIWVKSLISDFEQREIIEDDPSRTSWLQFETAGIIPLRNVWAVDGSYVTVRSEERPPKEVSFVKTALLTVDRTKLDAIDKEYPHPLLLQDVLTGSAIFHATVFPLKNVKTPLGNNYDAVRHIVRDSIRIDEDGAFFETLKWLAYRKWLPSSSATSPGFACPHCDVQVESGLPYDADEGYCPHCKGLIYLSDMLGFHLDMDEDSAPDTVVSAYMLIMEHLMLFTAIRVLWSHTDNSLVSETLFIKDGPLTLHSQYSKLVPNIRLFLEQAKLQGRPIHIVGQEKSGAFFDHLQSIVKFAPPKERGEPIYFAPLSHDYIHREVQRSRKRTNPYGLRTNWGEKLYLKIDPGTYMVLNVPAGKYKDDDSFPISSDLIGLPRILATIPSLVSHKFEGALFPIELANGIASMSNYPSAKILQRFIEKPARNS